MIACNVMTCNVCEKGVRSFQMRENMGILLLMAERAMQRIQRQWKGYFCRC